MKKRNKLFALLLAFAMVMGCMPAIAFANPDGGGSQGEMIDLEDCRIAFEGDADYDWAYYYSVNGKDAELNSEGLNITVVNGEGDVVDPDCYDLVLLRTWYSDDTQADISEEVEPPIGIHENDKDFGFTEYVAQAIGKEEKGYTGTTSGNFVIRDKYSLEFIGCNFIFENAVKSSWRMRDRFYIGAADMAEPGIMTVDGVELDPDTDYTIEYYRTARDLDEDDENYDFSDYLVIEDEYKLDSMPREEGQYFAVVKGLDPYYGENAAMIDITGFSNFEIDYDDEEALWSDGDKTFTLNLPDNVPATRKIKLLPEDEDYENAIELVEDEDFTYDSSTNELTLHGSMIFEKTDWGWPDLYVEYYEGDTLKLRGSANFELREARYDYDLPEDEELMPGWDSYLDDSIHAYIENADHPDGAELNLEITSADIISGEDFITLKKDDENGGWTYTAKGLGTATIEIEYEDYDGAFQTHTFNVNVSREVFNVDMWSENGMYKGLPGTSITLIAAAEKNFLIDEGAETTYGRTFKNLGFKWSITDGDEFATVKADAEDPGKAVVTFKDMPKGWDSIGERVVVKVETFDKKYPNDMMAEAEQDLYVEDEFYQIYPLEIDENLGAGKSITIKPELRRYKLGTANYSVVGDARFEITNYDEEGMSVNESNGTFTIKRIRDFYMDFVISADWEDGGEEAWYWFRSLDDEEEPDNARLVQDMINHLDTANPNKDAIDKARAAYNKLSDEEKEEIDTYRLTIAETKQAAKDKEAADRAAAKEAADRAAAEAARLDALEWNGTLSGAVPAAKSVKAKAAKKSVKVSWKKAKKKVLKKFDKVEIQVCPDKGFNRANTKRIYVKKTKKTKTVKGLVKGKTYYVRVRNFKGSGTGKLVSKWSKVKKVKIKK